MPAAIPFPARRPLSRLLATLGLATLALAACGGDDDPPTGVQGDFSFAISPSTLTLVQGESQTVTATLTRTGGFSGAVAATAQGVPANVTVTPLAIDSLASSATATVTVSATAEPGIYPIVISALASGLAAKVDTVELTIVATAVPMFTTTVTPDSLSVEQGDSASISVAVTRGGGFAGALTGVVSGLPDSVTASALTIAAAAASGTVTVQVSAAASPGDYTLVLTTSGTGVADQVDSLPLLITALPVPDLAVSFNPDSLNLAPGGQGVSTLAITRSGGFSGDVTLALQDSAPDGVTVTLPAAPVSGDSAVVTVAVGATAAAGSYPLIIEAAGTGVPTRTAVLTLVVPDLGSFSLAAQPANAAVTRGDSTTVTVVITRAAPFVAPVTLAVTGLPTGVTAVVVPNPAAGDTARITLVAAADAVLGGATLSVTGAGNGVSSAPLSIPLTVAASGGGAGNVTYTFCATEDLPAFVAYQDGTGPWVRATEGPDNSYSFNIASGKGGVAVVTTSTGSSDTDVEYGTVVELNQRGDRSCTTAVTGRSYTGTVAGTGASDLTSIFAGGATAIVAPLATTFSLLNASNDPFDLLASSINADSAANARAIIRRDIDAPSGSVLPLLDFASSEAFVPTANPLTITNSLAEPTSVFTSYLLRGGAFGGLYFTDTQDSTATDRTWFGIPAERQVAGDLHFVLASSFFPDAVFEETRTRLVTYLVAESRALNVVMPAVLTVPDFTTSAAGGNLAVAASYAVQADYGTFWTLSYSQTGASDVDATVTVTAAYANGSGTVNLLLPNFTGLAGWNTSWGLAPAAGITWTFAGIGWSGGFGSAPGGFTDGAVSRSATRAGALLLPVN